MRKCFVVLVMVGLMVGGCAMFQTAQGLLCNPTAQQKADAQLAVNAIDGLLTFFAAMPTPVQPEIAAALGGLKLAEPYFGLVVAGTCVALTDLQNAYNTLAGANQLAAAKSMKAGMRSTPGGMFAIPPASAFGLK